MSDPDAIRRAINRVTMQHANLLILSSSRAAGEAVAQELVDAIVEETGEQWMVKRRHDRTVVLDREGAIKGRVMPTETSIRGANATVVLDVLSTEEMRESARIALGPGTGARWIAYTGKLADLRRPS